MNHPLRSTSPHHYWLLDGAVLRAHPAGKSITSHSQAIALYADLGETAASVGPWLIDATAWTPPQIDPENIDLALVHGLAQLHFAGPPGTLCTHLQSIRHIKTDDGQTFFFRYADTRSLNAAKTALPAHYLTILQGPVSHWRYWQTDGTPTHLRPRSTSAMRRFTLPPLKLSQFEALIHAGAADRLATELQDLNENGLNPLHDARQLALVYRALQQLRTDNIQHAMTQRTIARVIVLSGAQVLAQAEYHTALSEARQGRLQWFEQWQPIHPHPAAQA